MPKVMVDVTECGDCPHVMPVSGYTGWPIKCVAKSKRGREIPYHCETIPTWCPYLKETDDE